MPNAADADEARLGGAGAADVRTRPARVTPDQYCADKAAQSGSSFHYSFRLLDPARRTAITALYAFCREVDDAVDEVADPDIARVKLAWWRTEVDALFKGSPHHPVAMALLPVVRRYGLPEAHLQTVIDGMQMDLETLRYLDFAGLELYLSGGGRRGLMSAEIFGYADPATRGCARDLERAYALDIKIRIADEKLPLAGIATDVTEFDRDGLVYEKNGVKVMAFEVDRARSWYDRALAQLPASDRRAQRAGLAMAAIYRTLLDEIARDGYQVLDRRIALTPLRKLWIATRAAWRA